MMSLTIGVSTCHDRYQRIYQKLTALPNEIQKLIVVQGGKKTDLSGLLAAAKVDQITVIHDPEMGISRSRNSVLDHCQTKYLLLADDDQDFIMEGIVNCVNYLEAHPDCDGVTGQVKQVEGALFRQYPSRERRHTYRSLLSVCTIEIMLRMSAIKASGVRFDERFGLGSASEIPLFNEECIFLNDLQHKKCNMQFLPVLIAVHPKHSSGEEMTKDRIIGRGATFYRMFGILGGVLLPFYTIRQRRYYRDIVITAYQFFKWVIYGFWYEMTHYPKTKVIR